MDKRLLAQRMIRRSLPAIAARPPNYPSLILQRCSKYFWVNTYYYAAGKFIAFDRNAFFSEIAVSVLVRVAKKSQAYTHSSASITGSLWFVLGPNSGPIFYTTCLFNFHYLELLSPIL